MIGPSMHGFQAGRIISATSGQLRALLPQLRLGAIVEVERHGLPPLQAEVVGVEDAFATLAPWSDPQGLSSGATVRLLHEAPPPICERRSRGRVISPLGADLFDGGGTVDEALEDAAAARWSNGRLALRDRIASCARVHTGIRVIDMLLPVVRGQRVGIFAGAGVGKTTLLSQLIRQVDADRVVIALIGERGREAVSFVEELRGKAGWERCTLIVATSDDPAAIRVRAAVAAMEIAAQSRARGEHCLIFIDSLTRWVRARRDLALLAGERAARGGFPPSAFAAMAPLLEAAGAAGDGAITAFYTVLLEGDQMDDPIGDEARGLVEAHWILNRTLAERMVFPAIDITASLSRLAGDAFDAETMLLYRELRLAFAALDEWQESKRFGLYEPGIDADADRIAANEAHLLDYIRQATDVAMPWARTQAWARELCAHLHQSAP